MSDANHAGSQTAQTTGTTGTQTAPTNGSAQAPVTLEQVQAAIQAALNPYAAALRKQQTATTTQQTSADGSSGISPAVAEAIRKAEEKGNRRTINAALKEAANEAGIPTTRLDTFKTLFEAKYGSNIKIGDDDSVSVLDGEIPKPINSFVKEYLKQPEGEIFRPAKQLATSSALSGSNQRVSGDRPFYHELPAEQRAKMSEAERIAYYQEDKARSQQQG